MNRRYFMQVTAGVATALWVGKANAQPASSASLPGGKPWQPWTETALRAHSDPRLRAVAHAILSPNTQNLQPWLIDVSSRNRIILRMEQKRKLSLTDFPDRQLTVSCGTFSEVLIMALEAEGFAVDLTLFPEGESWPFQDTRPVAIFDLKPASARRDPLLDQLLKRHTNRTAFDINRPPTLAQLNAIKSAARWPDRVHVNLEPVLANHIRDIVLRAYDEWMISYPWGRTEVAHWSKIGNAAIAADPHGPAMPDAFIAKAPGPVSAATLADPDSAIFKYNRENYRKAVMTGQAHLWITSPDYTRTGMFEAGRDWVRVHLKATELGLDMQPHSQPLFDFAQIMPYLNELHEATETPKRGRIQMLGRIGHGTHIGPSPRADINIG